MRNDYCTGYLMHHGIQGQKWGVRNGPPYPLDSGQKSSSEKKNFHLSDKQKRYLIAGAAITATALATYGAYKLGGVNGLRKFATIGAATAKPYMKMDLQYFAKKYKPVYSDGGCKFDSPEELARAEQAFHKNNVSSEDWNKPTLIKPVQTDDDKKGAFWYHAYKSIEDDKFKITHRVRIPDSATGLYERNINGKK